MEEFMHSSKEFTSKINKENVELEKKIKALQPNFTLQSLSGNASQVKELA